MSITYDVNNKIANTSYMKISYITHEFDHQGVSTLKFGTFSSPFFFVEGLGLESVWFAVEVLFFIGLLVIFSDFSDFSVFLFYF